MIELTRLNRKEQYDVNPDLIERILRLPDTTLVMVDGSRLIVAETRDEIVDKIVAFRARVLAAARALGDLPATTGTTAPAPLTLVDPVPPADPDGGGARPVPLRPRTT